MKLLGRVIIKQMQSWLNNLYLDAIKSLKKSFTLKLLLSMIVVIAIAFPIVASLCISNIIVCQPYLFESTFIIGAIAFANVTLFILIPLIIGISLNCCYTYVWAPETPPPMSAYLSFRDSFRWRFWKYGFLVRNIFRIALRFFELIELLRSMHCQINIALIKRLMADNPPAKKLKLAKFITYSPLLGCAVIL